MNKHHQFSLAIFSICLVILLGLSTVNQTIHDGLFHPNFATDTNPVPSGCTGHHEGECGKGESNKHSEECDSLSCPANVFANGVLAVDYTPEITTKTPVKDEIVLQYLISHHSEEEKRVTLSEVPPKKSRFKTNT